MSENDLDDPETRAAVREQLRKLQKMTVALQNIIALDEGRTEITRLARRAMEGKE